MYPVPLIVVYLYLSPIQLDNRAENISPELQVRDETDNSSEVENGTVGNKSVGWNCRNETDNNEKEINLTALNETETNETSVNEKA